MGEEVAAAKKTADLQAWAAKTLAAKACPRPLPCRSRLPRVPRSMRNLRLHVNSWTPAECWLPVEWQIFILQFSEWLPASVETPQQGRLPDTKFRLLPSFCRAGDLQGQQAADSQIKK